MKRKIGSAILAILLLVLVLSACAPSVDQTQVDELEVQKAQLEADLKKQAEESAAEISGLQDELKQAKSENEGLEAQVTRLQSELNAKSAQAAEADQLKAQIAELQAELAEFPKDPSYDQLMEFMAQDKTNEDDYWGHDDYAQVFLRNARNAGIQGYVVTIWIAAQQTWFLTGFETTDEGWVYIIPAADLEVKLEVGEEYHKLNDFDPFGVDDTILEITHD